MQQSTVYLQQLAIFIIINKNSKMMSKSSKKHSSIHNSKPLQTRKQYFDINTKKLRCFIQNQDTCPAFPQLEKNQNFNQQKPSQSKHNSETNQFRRDRVEDSPDITRRVVNDIIAKIQEQGLEFQTHNSQENTSPKSRSLSSQQHSFSFDQIWKSDWNLSSLKKSAFNSDRSFSTHSLKKTEEKANPSTHRSSNMSFSAYQQMQYSNQNCNSFYFYQQPVWNMYEIFFDNIDMDCRTTIMIKNIPNKYSLSELSDEIDATHAGQYDFLYLPFDNTSKCSIGYAFINLLTTEALKSFYTIYNLRKWFKFRSQKICELSYARLQGRNSLIDHLHSSKVFNQKGKNFSPVFKDYSQIRGIIAKQKQNTLNQTYLSTNF